MFCSHVSGRLTSHLKASWLYWTSFTLEEGKTIIYLQQLTHQPGIGLPILPIVCQSAPFFESLQSVWSTYTTLDKTLHWIKVPTLQQRRCGCGYMTMGLWILWPIVPFRSCWPDGLMKWPLRGQLWWQVRDGVLKEWNASLQEAAHTLNQWPLYSPVPQSQIEVRTFLFTIIPSDPFLCFYRARIPGL